MQRSTTPPGGPKRLKPQSSGERLSCATSQSPATILQPRFCDVQLSIKSEKGPLLHTLEELSDTVDTKNLDASDYRISPKA